MSTPTKERPILFKGAMVRAIMDGSKTQTRRILKLPPLQPWQSGSKGWRFIECDHSIEDYDNFVAGFSDGRGTIFNIKCLYGKPAFLDRAADRLWVRETWASAQHAIVAYRADGECGSWMHDGGGGRVWERHGGILGSGTPDRPEQWRGQMFGLSKFGGKWRPSIFMPRWASRISLEITAIRVERLQDISGPDCWAEGIAHAGWDPERYGSVVECYRDLWQSIHGPGSWDANPWLWVIQFQRIQQP